MGQNKMIINSRFFRKTFRFFLSKSGYVFCDDTADETRPGTLGFQPTWESGDTLLCSEQNFKQICKKWLRSEIRSHKKLLEAE